MNDFIERIISSKIVVRTKYIVSLFAKYFIKTMKALTIAYIWLFIPFCYHRPEYGAEYYNTYMIFHLLHIPLILFWWFYWTAKITIRGLSKGKTWYQRIKYFIFTMTIVIPMIFLGVIMAISMVFISYTDASYRECMRECVLVEDEKECATSFCEF